jgi:hypothetical protein
MRDTAVELANLVIVMDFDIWVGDFLPEVALVGLCDKLIS